MKTIATVALLTLVSFGAYADHDDAAGVSQEDFDAEVRRLDAEDMRVRSGEVVDSTLVLTVGDYGKSQGRSKIYTKEVKIDISSLKGANGNDGSNGTDGARGFSGSNGVDGINGIDGIDGNQGLTGARGSDGINGTNGSDGATGANGAQGLRGLTGLTGSAGSDGARGETGARGDVGSKGDKGDAGVDGINGIDGKDGKDFDRTNLKDLRAGIAAAIATAHAISEEEAWRAGFGYHSGEVAFSLGTRKNDKTFTFSIDSRGTASLGFGMNL